MSCQWVGFAVVDSVAFISVPPSVFSNDRIFSPTSSRVSQSRSRATGKTANFLHSVRASKKVYVSAAGHLAVSSFIVGTREAHDCEFRLRIFALCEAGTPGSLPGM